MEASKQIEDSYPELFPKDFGERLERLERLRELARLSWEEFAERLSADDDHVMEWRKGSVPSGGKCGTSFTWHRRFPEGVEVMLTEATEDYRKAE